MTRMERRPRWETVVRLVAVAIVLLLIAYGVAWYLGYLVPPPAGTYYPPRS
jgi:hypothetical protein